MVSPGDHARRESSDRRALRSVEAIAAAIASSFPAVTRSWLSKGESIGEDA
jgi:hypothetical protein